MPDITVETTTYNIWLQRDCVTINFPPFSDTTSFRKTYFLFVNSSPLLRVGSFSDRGGGVFEQCPNTHTNTMLAERLRVQEKLSSLEIIIYHYGENLINIWFPEYGCCPDFKRCTNPDHFIKNTMIHQCKLFNCLLIVGHLGSQGSIPQIECTGVKFLLYVEKNMKLQ